MSQDTFAVGPELTIYHVAELRPQWLAAWAAGTRRFDLSQVTEIDGAGAQMLASLWRMAQRDDETVSLTGAGSAVHEALSLLGASMILTPTGAEAADA